MNKPKDNWLSPYTIIEKAMFWREIDYDEPIVKYWHDALEPFCNALHSVRKFINRDIRYVKIDPWDVWSMDWTLAPIILPMLKELKRVKHGAPFVDDEDVPPKLRSKQTKRLDNTKNKYANNVHAVDGLDPNWHKRFDYILDEMIWTFEQLNNWDHDSEFFDHSQAKNPKDSLNTQLRKIKIDHVGLKKHEDRIDNGLRLFGKYFRSLWD